MMIAILLYCVIVIPPSFILYKILIFFFDRNMNRAYEKHKKDMLDM